MKTSVALDVYTFDIIFQNYASPDSLPSLLLASPDLMGRLLCLTSVSFRVCQCQGVKETFYGYDDDENDVSIDSENSQSSVSVSTISEEDACDEVRMSSLEQPWLPRVQLSSFQLTSRQCQYLRAWDSSYALYPGTLRSLPSIAFEIRSVLPSLV